MTLAGPVGATSSRRTFFFSATIGHCLVADARGDDHFDELAVDDRASGLGIQRHVEGDDAAKGAGRVGGEGLLIGFERLSRRRPRRKGWRA